MLLALVIAFYLLVMIAITTFLYHLVEPLWVKIRQKRKESDFLRQTAFIQSSVVPMHGLQTRMSRRDTFYEMLVSEEDP